MNAITVKRTGLAACIAAAAFLHASSFIYNGDCAVSGLMATHISQLKEFPLYFWAAHYSGTLTSYLAAGLFAVFGVSRPVGALSGIFVYWLWVVLQYVLARRLLSPAGAVAVLLLCLFPPLQILHFSTWTGGVYPETFAFSAVLFLFAAYRAGTRPERPGLYYLAAGAAAGFGQWLSPGMLPASAAALVFFAAAEKRDFWRNCLPFFAAGFAAGYAPAIVYSLEYPNAALYRMGGRLLGLDRSFLGEPHKTAVIAGRIARKIIEGPGDLLKLPVYYMQAAGPFNLLLLTGAAALAFREAAGRLKKKMFPGAADIVLVYAIFFAAFYAFVISAPDALRFAIPLYVAAPMFLARAFEVIYSRRRRLAAVILAALLCVNLFPAVNALREKPFAGVDALTAYMEGTGLKYAFSDYHTSYLVTFLTREKVIVSPTLLHKDFFERYPEYTREVRNSLAPAFIIDNVNFPGWEAQAEARLKALGISFEKTDLGGYTVLNSFSRRVYPEDLGLQLKL